LDTIGSTGRRALQELRSLLGALEQTQSVAPSEPFAGTVAELVAEAQARGYPVTFSEPLSQPDMSEPVRGTLYRIAQEALTNAMKHSPNSPVAVALTERDGRVELRVTNDIGEGSPGAPGRGRTGMSARSTLLGGTFEAGVVDGRFRVLASFDSNAEAYQ
jgi:signal transduction histidine kinase